MKIMAPLLTPKEQKKQLITIFGTVFLDFLGVGILIPILPSVFVEPSSPNFILPSTINPSMGYVFLSLVMGLYSLSQFLTGPILGQLSDRHGRKKILLFSFCGTLVANILLGLGLYYKNLILVLLSRIVQGGTSGSLSVSMASMIDFTKKENRSKRFGVIGAAIGTGMILGPFVGGFLSDPHVLPFFNVGLPFFFNAGLSLINILLLSFAFKETLRTQRDDPPSLLRPIFNIFKAMRYPTHRISFLFVFLFQMGFTMFNIFFSVFLAQRFGFSSAAISYMFVYIGICIAISQFTTLRLLAYWKVKDYVILPIAILGVALIIFLYTISAYWWLLLFFIPFSAIFIGAVMSYTNVLISRKAAPNIQGEILGINTSVIALAQAIPGLLSGFLVAWIGTTNALHLASALLILASIIFTIFFRERPEKLGIKGIYTPDNTEDELP